MKKEEIQKIAFTMISHVGEANSCFYKALEMAKKGSFEQVSYFMKKGEKKLLDAHKSQTALLSAEARNEDVEFSIIMIHAQDTLMSTIMFERLVKEIIDLHKERRGVCSE